MIKRVIIDQIEITRDGTLQIRMAKEVVDDDGKVILSGWHRTSLPPDGDIDQQITVVNESLIRDLGYPAINEEEAPWLRTIIPLVHTEAVKEKYRQKREKIDEELKKVTKAK